MKNIYEVLQQKEQRCQCPSRNPQPESRPSLLSEELALRDAGELLRQKEGDVARVRREIVNLKIVARLVSEELPSDEQPKMGAGSAAE